MNRSIPTRFLVVGVFGFGLMIASCSSDQPGQSGITTTTQEAQTSVTQGQSEITAPKAIDQPEDELSVSFNDDFGSSIAPILERRCASCHNPGGPGTSRWLLETAEDAAANSKELVRMIQSGVMPPWPAGPLSVPFHNDRSLTDDELVALVDWSAAGGELDVEPATPIVAINSILQMSEVDQALAPGAAYQGSTSKPDDYRCFVYDPALAEPAWMLGYNFVPDQTEVVHHAIGYLMSQADRTRADAKAAEDDKSGWECYGGSGIGQDDLFLGWAPGQGPSEYPDGAALRIPAGAFFVVQIHYHFDHAAPPDLSKLEIDFDYKANQYDEITISEYVAPAEIPCAAQQSGPLCDRDAAYTNAIERFGPQGVRSNQFNALCGVTPADFAGMTDGTARSSCDLPVYGFGRIVSVLGHEHEIGKTFRMTLNPGRAEEQILLDIPKWDFDWQYNYEPAEEIIVRMGDTLRIECSWDRALQAPGTEPSYILWADGTNDEMCFSTIVTRSP